MGYLCTSPRDSIKSLSLDLCGQLQPGEIKSEMAEQVIKNLVFVARTLQKVPLTEDKTINLLWLAKKMRKIVNTEVVLAPSSTALRLEVFKWIGAIVAVLQADVIQPLVYHLLAPLVREMLSTEVSNAPLRQLAKEVGKMIKKRIGLEQYSDTLLKAQKHLSLKRTDRKREMNQLAVTDPEAFAQKKIKRHEMKKESKKRKIAIKKGTPKKTKRRKVVELDDFSDII